MATSVVKIASVECPIALIDSYLKRRLDVNVNACLVNVAMSIRA